MAPTQLPRKAIAIPLAVVSLALAPAGAWGADLISNSGNSFDRSTYNSDEGELVYFQHTGGAPHDVTSDQGPGALFESETISGGTTPVNGTQSLPPGTFPFHCSVHPTQMKAVLVVRDTGAPGPNPGPGPPLTLDLEAKKQELREKLKFFATATIASTLVAKGKAIRETTKRLAANQKTTVKAKLKPAKRRRLEEQLERFGKAKTRIEATATNQSGETASDVVKVKLKD